MTMPAKKRHLSLALLVLLPLAPGCGTLATHTNSAPPQFQEGVYRGVRYDAYWFEGNTTWLNYWDEPSVDAFLAIWNVCDLACSLVLDTVFLPYDAIKVWVEAPPAPPKPKPRLEDSETYQKPLEEK